MFDYSIIVKYHILDSGAHALLSWCLAIYRIFPEYIAPSWAAVYAQPTTFNAQFEMEMYGLFLCASFIHLNWVNQAQWTMT